MTKKVDKALTEEVRNRLSAKLKEQYKDSECYVLDYDSELGEVYIEVWKEDTGYKLYKLNYTLEDGVVTLSEDLKEVYVKREYEEVKNSDLKYEEMEKSILNKMSGMFSKYFGEGNQETITKSYEAEYITFEPLYIGAYEVDGVGDAYYNSEECYTMVDNLLKAIEDGLSGNFFHAVQTEDFQPIDAFCNRVDTLIDGTDVVIPANQPVVVLKYNNKETFNLRKSGDLLGPSIGANAAEIVDISTGKIISKNASIILGSEKLEDEPVVKRLLKGITFNLPHNHVALTDASQGGACSLKNDYFLAKANYKKKLTKEQKELLEKMGHDISEIEKSMDENNKSSASSEAGEADNLNIDKGNDNTMSEEIQKELAQLRKDLAVSKAENLLTKYNFELDLNKDLAEVLAQVKDQEAVLKAFDALIADGKAKIEKAIEDATATAKADMAEELKKAKAEGSDNELLKALTAEAGEGGETESEVEMTRSQKIAKHLKKDSE